MKRRKNQIVAVMMGTVIAASALAGCGDTSENGTKDGSTDINTVGKSTDFSFLITTAITQNQYDDYNDNPVAQWWTSREWDADGDGKGTSLNIDFWAPTAGAEKDYVNTLISTEEYPDVMPMMYSGEGVGEMYEEGMVLDLTEYIDAYMPNYKAYMEAHPEFLYTNKLDGEDKYVQLYLLNEDYNPSPWCGFMYRRDWIVKYGRNSETGEAFTGEWNAEGQWEDDVVFPSGNTDPVYISDWEWMMEIFETARKEQGMTGGYVLQIPYEGVHMQGDLVSGFNTGVTINYDNDGKVVCDATSEGFRAYVECMSNWYAKGWVDPAFAERAGDMFFMIDNESVYSGQVGVWYGLASQLEKGLVGDGSNPWTADAVVCAAATPINDVYGDESVQNKEPSLCYQDALLSSAFVITDKAKDKDIATLLTAIDYFYSEEGARIYYYGFGEDQMEELKGTPSYDFYKELGLENGVWKMEGETMVVDPAVIEDTDLSDVTSGKRMLGMTKIKNVDKGYSETKLKNFAQWTKYNNTKEILLDVRGQLKSKDTTKYSSLVTNLDTCMAQWLPSYINGTYDVTDDAQWQKYVDEIDALNPGEVVEALNEIAAAK